MGHLIKDVNRPFCILGIGLELLQLRLMRGELSIANYIYLFLTIRL